jgi:hypothetical protein
MKAETEADRDRWKDKVDEITSKMDERIAAILSSILEDISSTLAPRPCDPKHVTTGRRGLESHFWHQLWRVLGHRGVGAMFAGCFWHQLAACPCIRDE